jgi:hypothetical protein
LLAEGFRPAVTATLEDALHIWKSLGEKVVGIITDLHFPEKTTSYTEESDASKACGLAIVAQATKQGMPVVVCSNINHHFVMYPEKVIRVLAGFHPLGEIPFVMDSKDWKRAAVELKRMIERRSK